MKANLITAFGGPEVLRIGEVPEPKPGPGQVAIKVAYAGVNFAETMARRGGRHREELPFIPGLEVSGHIHALGEGVEGLRVGQPVAALTLSGGYAEVALAQATLTFPLDATSGEIDLATAAGFPTIVPTAYDMLVRVAHLQPGETILVHAAAGGVGSIAGQIARHLGAGLVIGTVSSQKKADYAKSFGYDHVILRDDFLQQTQELTQGRGVDVILEAIGEPVRSQSLTVLAPFGRLVIFGNASDEQGRGQSLPQNPGNFLVESKAIMGYSIGVLSATAPHLVADTARRSLELVARSQVKIDITDILPLEQASEAHRRLETGQTMGKLLLRI
ncbi:NADPH:quinone reductase [Ktedonobacter sp. SOSP1-52]|uniref:quinone oxidoreductase family protein n=1 Tax=Ktedonobacter sp. SOSP1-52 TaxID=2778366 RepID=UPI0019168FD4|nr:NADPH:quinone oxidoreductase family protein [Ktedonobacter sp. SOSP1-52]GHO69160.1 NADPH:quinone reductase [Ktedonobacter sp. SOSP1-52]